jgi:hypothetical protein
MALTRVPGGQPLPTVIGNVKMSYVAVAFDATYLTGGELISPGLVGLNQIYYAWPTFVVGAYTAEYQSTGSIVLKNASDGAQVTSDTDVATVVVGMVFVGI